MTQTCCIPQAFQNIRISNCRAWKVIIAFSALASLPNKCRCYIDRGRVAICHGRPSSKPNRFYLEYATSDHPPMGFIARRRKDSVLPQSDINSIQNIEPLPSETLNSTYWSYHPFTFLSIAGQSRILLRALKQYPCQAST